MNALAGAFVILAFCSAVFVVAKLLELLCYVPWRWLWQRVQSKLKKG